MKLTPMKLQIAGINWNKDKASIPNQVNLQLWILTVGGFKLEARVGRDLNGMHFVQTRTTPEGWYKQEWSNIAAWAFRK